MRKEKKTQKSEAIEEASEEANQDVLEKYSDESKMRHFSGHKITSILVFVIAIAYSAYHLWLQFNPLPTLEQRSIHVAVGLALIFVLFPLTKTRVNRRCRY